MLNVSMIGCGFVGARFLETVSGEREEEFIVLKEMQGAKIILNTILVKNVLKYPENISVTYTSSFNDLLSDNSSLVIDATNNETDDWVTGTLTDLAKAGKSVIILNKPLLAKNINIFSQLEKQYGVKFLIGACISKNSPINVNPSNYFFDGTTRFEQRGHSSDDIIRAIFEEILYFYNK